jgi:hypothetical protein
VSAARHTEAIVPAEWDQAVARVFLDEPGSCAFCDDSIDDGAPAVAIRSPGEETVIEGKPTLTAKPSTTLVCMVCAFESDDAELRGAARDA